MKYTYATLLLTETGAELNERNLIDVLEAAGADVSVSRVKATIAALEGVDIEEAVGTPPADDPAPPVDEGDEPHDGDELHDGDGLDTEPADDTEAEDEDTDSAVASDGGRTVVPDVMDEQPTTPALTDGDDADATGDEAPSESQ